MNFLDKKDFLIVKKLKALNYENNMIDVFIFNQLTAYDFLIKKQLIFLLYSLISLCIGLIILMIVFYYLCIMIWF
jgi:hypothetical protein